MSPGSLDSLPEPRPLLAPPAVCRDPQQRPEPWCLPPSFPAPGTPLPLWGLRRLPGKVGHLLCASVLCPWSPVQRMAVPIRQLRPSMGLRARPTPLRPWEHRGFRLVVLDSRALGFGSQRCRDPAVLASTIYRRGAAPQRLQRICQRARHGRATGSRPFLETGTGGGWRPSRRDRHVPKRDFPRPLSGRREARSARSCACCWGPRVSPKTLLLES